MNGSLRIVVFGGSLNSSQDNRHLAHLRGLLREIYALGHDIVYVQRDTPNSREDPDLPRHYFCQVETYRDVEDLRSSRSRVLADADFVFVCSEIDEGEAIGHWVIETAKCPVAFWDLDTPATLSCLSDGLCDYLSAPLVARYDLYLASSGGPAIDLLRRSYGAPLVKTLYASFDQEQFYPQTVKPMWHLGYRGSLHHEQAGSLNELLFEPAKRFADVNFTASELNEVAGIESPPNVVLFDEVLRSEQRRFYNSHRFMLSLAPPRSADTGFSPTSALLEAAACGVPVICEYADGLEGFLQPKTEVLTARNHEDVVRYLRTMSEAERNDIGDRARDRILKEHTAAHRALELEGVLEAVLERTPEAYLL